MRAIFKRVLAFMLIPVALFFSILYILQSELSRLAEASGEKHPFSDELPPQCHALESTFREIQLKSSKKPVVFACHRAWCDSFFGGFCSPCMGIGDRTQHLLLLSQEAMSREIPFRIDHPLPDIIMPDEAVYQAPWWEDLLQYRSYDVVDRKTVLSDWGVKPAFAHFFASTQLSIRTFDPCWFRILFRPALHLKRDIAHHLAAMNQDIIGIHFRTGDGVAFKNAVRGTENSKRDVRLTGSLESAFHSMLQCANNLRQNLFPDRQVTFFVATDNPTVKRLYQDTIENVYLTDCEPSSFLDSRGERCTWLDVFLLLQSQGLVMNVKPRNYNGTAAHISKLASLVIEVNSFDKDHVWECDLTDS